MERWPFDPRVKSLLVRFLKAAKIVKKPYAVGGALAMSSYGYTRQTQDVDAFVQYDDRVFWFRALQQQGLTLTTEFQGIHYKLTDRKHRDPDVHIDLLIPAGDPELSAVEAPESRRIGGIDVDLFPLDILVISKFISDRPEDWSDVDRLYERGLFVPAQVASTLKYVDQKKVKPFLERYP